ncbi:MAG: hypothetical protein L6Q47_16910 [Ignavibacteriaceae bacterium]|nr:hypothetical protein [Ignavibacteriaceae bacterium]
MERIIILVGIIILFNSCSKDNPVTPQEPQICTYQEGDRNYTWRMDTIAIFPSWLGGIWAFSDSDAYVMGNIFQLDSSNNLQGYIGLHWDGNHWSKDINGTVEEIKHVANDVTGDDFYMVSVGNWAINPSKPGIGEFDNRTKKWKGYQFSTAGELRSVWTDEKGYFIAVGDNGMVYTKDGYTASWVYSKAPTEFNFTKVRGISKNEIYVYAYKSVAVGGFNYYQLWRYYDNIWTKLFDTQDSTGNHLDIPVNSGYSVYSDIAVSRCAFTDSLTIYLCGWESYMFQSKGSELKYKTTNLEELGYPLRSLERMGLSIKLFSPNDYWIFGSYYLYAHYNGKNFELVNITELVPYSYYSTFRKMVKTKSKKIFLAVDRSSQVYAVVQGNKQ